MICDGKSMAFSGHFRQSPRCPVRISDHRPLGADIRAAGRARSILGAALLARGALFARKDTLVDRAGLSNESLPLWDKRYYFAHGAYDRGILQNQLCELRASSSLRQLELGLTVGLRSSPPGRERQSSKSCDIKLSASVNGEMCSLPGVCQTRNRFRRQAGVHRKQFERKIKRICRSF